MTTRFVERVGSRICVIAYTPGCKKSEDFPNHWGRVIIHENGDHTQEGLDKLFESYRNKDISDEYYGRDFICTHCGERFKVDRHLDENGVQSAREHEGVSLMGKPIYSTPSGDIEPGCMYWNDWYPDNFFWDNQEGPYLMVQLPNGHDWCIDSRASNCGLPNDRTHRCWVRHGIPPHITVDKNGLTCNAGAGSISVKGWHGFLRGGELVEC